ncbi:aspartate kinase, partial [Aegicerativicinus sediminis]
MKDQLQHLVISDYTTLNGVALQNIPLSYQTFGQELGTAPIVLVNHALTGNSNVAGQNGWWNSIIGEEKVIDTKRYSILSFNIPGNGYDGYVIDNYEDFVARDVARIFIEGLKQLGISKLFAIIGGSLGGGIAWEMAVLQPKLAEHLIPVATDWKATDWLIANCHIQQQFLLNSKNPVNDARMHAMLCYRTPVSFNERFNRTKNDELQVFNVQSWLMHHGKKLQERFQLSAYKLMNQLLATIDVTKWRDGDIQVLDAIESHIHIIGVDSDMFFSAEENRKTHKQLALSNPNITYHEIHSDHGHDAFLIEFDQLEHILLPIFKPEIASEHIKVLKFGGKSLANGVGINQVVSIIKSKHELNDKLVVVVSARGKTTDDLLQLIYRAEKGENYQKALGDLINNQKLDEVTFDVSSEKHTLERLLKGVEALGYCTPRTKDEILAQGELFSIKAISSLLNSRKIPANAIDSREIIKTNSDFGDAQPLYAVSKELTMKAIKNGPSDIVYVVSGFIGSDLDGTTTTLGRNGSNYTAALLANYLEAEELQNFTHVDGIFTANPEVVKNAKKIEQLTFDEANEIAHFGAEILHAKTIIPLIEKNINLRILNTYNPDDSGTLITSEGNGKGMKSISAMGNRALVQIEGRGLMGKAGIDERIFRALGQKGISVSIISQGSSERGIGVVVDASESEKAQKALKQEFSKELEDNDVNKIAVLDGVAVVSLIGQDLSSFHRPYSALVKNEIVPILFNNTVTGKNVSIV